MFEARLTQGKVFKQLIEALKDLVQEANIDCTDDEISIQAMDNSHVSLVAVSLRSGGFDHFRCDRPISLGFNAANMGKILKCAGNDDVITLRAEDEGDSLALVFESPGQDRIADFGELACCWRRCCYCCCGCISRLTPLLSTRQIPRTQTHGH
jgi:proliferating cell nuclear antigen